MTFLICFLILFLEDAKGLYRFIEKVPEAGPKAHRCTVCGKIGNDRGNLRNRCHQYRNKDPGQLNLFRMRFIWIGIWLDVSLLGLGGGVNEVWWFFFVSAFFMNIIY